MVRNRWAFGQSLLLLGLCAVLAGCPLVGPMNGELYLVVTPSELHFGSSLDSAVLTAHKSASNMTLGAIVVTPTAPWIVVDQCKGIEDGCISDGPLDQVEVTVHVDRSLMEPGDNAASVRVSANGAAVKVIPVTATATVVANFYAENRAPETVDVVQFEDRSEVVPGWTITSWFWDFGDDTTSTAQNPAPHRYLEAGNYDVSLTVAAVKGGSELTVTTTREGYIVVTDKEAPTADFSASMTDTFVNTPVWFTSESTPGTAAISDYQWDFGDGETSTDQNPQHIYTDIGTFTVSLTVLSTDGSDTETKTDFIVIRPVPPTADFEANETKPAVNDPVQFVDLSDPGSAPIASWQWDFGDGESSDAQDPVHTFTTEGTFTVSLRVTTAHGTDIVTKTDYITTHIVPPTADFTSDETRILVGDSIKFSDSTDPGSSPVTSWEWDFGDGATSTNPNPSHTYTVAGRYDVSLTVETDHGTDTELKSEYVAVFVPTALDRYLRNGDESYSFTLLTTLTAAGAKVHVIDLTSQTWREGFVDQPVWSHYLTIVEPATISSDTALMFVSGGSSTSSAPSLSNGDIQALAALAVQTQSVTALISQVPNQPLVFSDETEGRTEDEIIAYTFDKFLDTGDEEWPALLPMVKSVVRAMDAVQDFDSAFSTSINHFVVTGASKRGWTTWLTAAADNRVVAIAPMVIDVLNMDVQMQHHYNVYGYYAEDIQDYVAFDIFDRFNTTYGPKLLETVDPYQYRDRLDMPKYIVNATGDQFFVPDSAQFYYDQLIGPKHLRYIPNVDHGLGGYADVVAGLMPWYLSILDPAETAPAVDWTVEAENRIKVEVGDVTPTSAKLWFATSQDRDFRKDPNLNAFTPPVWSSINLSPTSPGMYIGEVATPPTAWTGFFVELTLPSPYTNPYIFTTEVRVTPDVYPVTTPFPPVVDFTVAGEVTSVVTGDSVQFYDLTNPGTRPILVWAWDFGDGTTSSEQNPTHVYDTPGDYDVSLSVTTVYGTVTETKTAYISVANVP